MKKIIKTIEILLIFFCFIFTFSGISFAQNGSTKAIDGNPDILVSPVQGPSVGNLLIARTKTSWPWYLTRTSGLIAAVSLFILIFSGIGLVTGYTFRFLEPLTAWATHRALGIIFAISLLIHGTSLLFDKYVPFSISQVLFPFLSNYKVVSIWGHRIGSLYVALGIIAGYLLLALVLSTYFWIDKKPKNWKMVHFLAYLIVIFVFIHGLYVGTDLSHGTLRTLWIIMGGLIGISIIYRFTKVRNI